MMLIPFHSQAMGNRAIIRKQWKKEQSIFLFIRVLGQKQEGYQQEQGPLAWPKDAVPGTAGSAMLVPQEQRPRYGLEKSPVPSHCLPEIPSVSHPFCEGKNPHTTVEEYLYPLHEKNHSF